MDKLDRNLVHGLGFKELNFVNIIIYVQSGKVSSCADTSFVSIQEGMFAVLTSTGALKFVGSASVSFHPAQNGMAHVSQESVLLWDIYFA